MPTRSVRVESPLKRKNRSTTTPPPSKSLAPSSLVALACASTWLVKMETTWASKHCTKLISVKLGRAGGCPSVVERLSH